MAASLLSQQGIDTVVLERETFPRYHIGESLISSVLFFADLIGLRDKLDGAGFVRKPGAIFHVSEDEVGYVDFSLNKDHSYAYNVRRSEFDQLLLEHARELGAQVFEATRVTDVQLDGDRAVAATWRDDEGVEGSVRFRWVIDASGLAGLLSRQLFANRRARSALKNVAIGVYHEGVQSRYALVDGREIHGAQTIEACRDETGWMWCIPNEERFGDGGCTSLGLVIHQDYFQSQKSAGADLAAIFQRGLETCPVIKLRLAGGSRVTEYKVWSDWSYKAEQLAGPGWFLIGDAAAFIDPLFSTGIHLAFVGAVTAAASISSLTSGTRTFGDEAEIARFHHDYVDLAYTRFLVAVLSVYLQMGAQQDAVLADLGGQPVGRAFDMITPLVSGSMDTATESATREQLVTMLRFSQRVARRTHGLEPNERENAAELFAHRLVRRARSHDFGRLLAVNGISVEARPGRVALHRVSAVERAALGAAKKVAVGSLRAMSALGRLVGRR
jgi:flavin-dependent dehydrogenase